MKKLLCILIAAALVALTLCACTGNDEPEIDVDSLEALKVGVLKETQTSQDIFKALSSRIAKKGYRVEFVEFGTADEANSALAANEIDISLTTRKAEFQKYEAENPDTLLNLGPVYTFPYGIFLCNFEEFEDITDKSVIAVPEDSEGLARALLLLEANGLIKLKDDAGLDTTLDDIAENSREFKFVRQSNDKLAANLETFEADIAVMSSQVCVSAGHALNRSARAIEETGSKATDAYSYILLINKDAISSEKYKTVNTLYFSPLMYETIDNYQGDVMVPAFNLSKSN